MTEFASILKAYKWFALVGSLLLVVIIPTISGLIYGAKTGDWKPALDASAGSIFASGQTITNEFNLYTNTSETISQIPNLPPDFKKEFQDHIKEKIIIALLIMISWAILFYYLGEKIIGEAAKNLGTTLLFIIPFTIFMLALMEFIYSLAVPPHKLIVPLKWLYLFIKNIGIWGAI